MREMLHGASNVVILAVSCHLCGKGLTVPVMWSYWPYHATNVRNATRCQECGNTGRVMPLMWEWSHGASNVVILAVSYHYYGKCHTVPVMW